MGRYDDIIDKLLRWARLEDDVRAVIIVGSQARTYELADRWSDLCGGRQATGVPTATV